MSDLTVEAILAGARRIVAEAPLGWLITSGTDAQVHARVMQPFPVGDDLVLWFGTSPSSRKVADVAATGHGTAGFSSADGAGYVTATGPVEMITDPATLHRLWREDWDRFFPGGPETGYVVLKLSPRRIEVLDFAHGIAPPPFGAVAAAVEWRGTEWGLP
ncbi:MAG: pyridoxamine 5'-phosphate oxidase family protein [Candidatus Nanopelagicales bacterium]